MSIPHLYYLTPFPIEQEKHIPNEPLDLSSGSPREEVAQLPVQQTPQELDSSICKTHSIVNKNFPIKIKDLGRYTSDIKHRVQKARRLGMHSREIAKTFNLKKSQVAYINRCNKKESQVTLIDRCNRATLIEQPRHPMNSIPDKNPSSMTIEKLEELLCSRCIQQFKEEI